MTGVQRLTRFRDLSVIVRKPAINVLCRSENEDRILAHIVKDIDRAFYISEKNLIGRLRIFVKMSGEMNHHIVVLNRLDVVEIQNVEIRAS